MPDIQNAINISLPNEVLQEAINNHLIKLFTSGQYDNPITKIIENQFGYNWNKNPELTKVVMENVDKFIQSEDFTKFVGEAFAKEIARREADRVERSKR